MNNNEVFINARKCSYDPVNNPWLKPRACGE